MILLELISLKLEILHLFLHEQYLSLYLILLVLRLEQVLHRVIQQFKLFLHYLELHLRQLLRL